MKIRAVSADANNVMGETDKEQTSGVHRWTSLSFLRPEAKTVGGFSSKKNNAKF